MSSPLYYQESGKAPVGGLVKAALMGLVATTVLAFVYSYVILYMPIAGYITFILSAGFGALTGVATMMGLSSGKVRNAAARVVVSSVVALVGFYVAWAVWIYALMRRADVDIALADVVLQPGVLWDVIGSVNEHGAWSMKGFTPTGGVLWFLWLVEAVLILGPAIVMGSAFYNVFCEGCDDFCETSENVAIVPNAEASSVQAWSEQKNFTAFEGLGPVAQGSQSFLRMDLHTCAKCNNTHALDVQHVALSLNDKNEVQTTVTPIVQRLLVSSIDVARIKQLGQTRAAQAQQAAPG